MATRNDIMDVIYDWFVSVSGIANTVWAFQSQPKKTRPYAVLRLFSWLSYQGGLMEQRIADADSLGYGFEVTANAPFVLSIIIIGEDGIDPVPFDKMTEVKMAIHDPASMLQLKRRQTDTVRVKSVLNYSNYVVTIEGVPIQIASGPSATELEIRNALVAAINASSHIGDISAVNGSIDKEFIIKSPTGIEFDLILEPKLTLFAHVGTVDLAYITEFGINDLTRLLETKYESRAQMDIKFNSHIRRFRTADTIETVDGEVNDLTFEVTV